MSVHLLFGIILLGIRVLCVYCLDENITLHLNGSLGADDSLGTDDFTIHLHYKDLVVHGKWGPSFPTKTIHPAQMWVDIAEKIKSDASRPPFSAPGSASRYDVWPVLSLDPSSGRAESPSYLTRFSVVTGGTGCNTPNIDAQFLTALSRLFYVISEKRVTPMSNFAGTIDRGGVSQYYIRLYYTGPLVARVEAHQPEVYMSDLIALNTARTAILSQTTSNDLLLFLGNTGAYLYHTINHSRDRQAFKRNAHLIALSSASEWSEQVPLDVLEQHPTYYNRFLDTVMKPIFNEFQRTSGSKSRVIVIDYTHTGVTVESFYLLLHRHGIWQGPMYFMNVVASQAPRPQPVFPHVAALPPIDVVYKHELDVIKEGWLGRIIAPYPWHYWDVDARRVRYMEEHNSKNVIRTIRAGTGVMSESAVAINSTYTGLAGSNSSRTLTGAIRPKASYIEVNSTSLIGLNSSYSSSNSTIYDLKNVTDDAELTGLLNSIPDLGSWLSNVTLACALNDTISTSNNAISALNDTTKAAGTNVVGQVVSAMRFSPLIATNIATS